MAVEGSMRKLQEILKLHLEHEEPGDRSGGKFLVFLVPVVLTIVVFRRRVQLGCLQGG